MQKIKVCCCLLLLLAMGASESVAQVRFERPLGAVLAELEAQFGVKISARRCNPDTLSLAYADFRRRPYSLSESLDNLLKPLGLVWREEKGRIVVQPYEYYRRTPADGERLLAWLSAKYSDRTSWEERREQVLAGVRKALAMEPFLEALAENPQVRLGRRVKHQGYTTQNYALETLPGLYVCGTIYAPAKRGGKHPLILSPSGHWEGGRYRADQQYRMATFARMGTVAVDMDIVGWGESEEQIGREAHQQPYAMQLQLLWSKCVLDWVVATRDDIDPSRMAATGGSGGATHTLLLAVMDERLSVLAPVVHLVSHFDGGCPCESGRAITLAAGGSCTPEILAAAMAPKPLLVVSDGGDWTATYPTLEYPFLQRIWGFYGAEQCVENAHFPTERHDYGENKRRAVYDFFARRLGLDPTQVDESKVRLQTPEALQTFAGDWPEGAIRSREALEQLLARF